MALDTAAREELQAKREANIVKKEEERKARVEEIKAFKAEQAKKRATAAEARAEELKKEEERLAKLAEVEKRREENIARRERERKERADAIKDDKIKKKRSKYSKADVLLLKEVYDQYDTDKSGTVSIAELQAALRQTALAGSSESMLNELDKNGDGSVDFGELLKVRGVEAATRRGRKRLQAHAQCRCTRPPCRAAPLPLRHQSRF